MGLLKKRVKKSSKYKTDLLPIILIMAKTEKLKAKTKLLEVKSALMEQGNINEVQDVFTSVSSSKPCQPKYSSLSAINQHDKKIRHHIADVFGNWKPSNVQPHGRIRLQASISTSA